MAMYTTPLSLLERLREPAPSEAWPRFVELYTPLFHYWAGRLTQQDNDACDLVQDVFAILVKEMPHFNCRADKRFRGWLWTMMLNRWRQIQRRRVATNVPLSESRIEDAVAPEITEALDDEEYRQYLINRCLQLMQTDFQPVTWKACWEYVVEDRSAVEVAAELGITINAVHLAKSRVLRRLREELQGMLD